MTELSGASGTSAPPRVSELSYAEASRELDELVAFFEQNEVDVDMLVAKLERANAIVAELDRRVRATRIRVEELVPELQAVVMGPDPDQARGYASGAGPEVPGDGNYGDGNYGDEEPF